MEMSDILRGDTEASDDAQEASTEVTPDASTVAAQAPAKVETQAPAADASRPPTGEQSTQTPGAAASGQTPAAQGATPGTESEVSGLLSALKDERTKRQQLKQEVDELKRLVGDRNAQPPQQTQQQEPSWDDRVIEDLPGSFKKLEQRFDERLNSRVRELKYRTSETYARQFIPDYADVMADYPKLIEGNAQLAQYVDQSDAPALAAYQVVKQHRAMQAQRPEVIEQRVRGESQTRIQQLESEVAQLKAQATAGSVPTSLTSARGSGAATPKADDDPEPSPWSEILKPRARSRR
jgi:hypothetical protein